MLSIIIPSRDPRFLQKTVDDLLAKAEGAVEIIVVLDGYWTRLADDPRVVIVHQGTIHNSRGMREGINAGMSLARGDYVMKIDEHCMVDQGYDLKLIADCADDWVVIPRRYRLDAEKWALVEDSRPPIDYMYIEFPYVKPLDKTQGIHGAEDKERFFARKDIEVDTTMTMQGSCYFMKKSHWENILPNGMDSELYGTFTHEAQEISMTTWLSGGRVVVNKKTWYAHLHKGKKYGTGYGYSTEQWKRHAESMEKGRLSAIDYWLSTKDYKYDFEWLLKQFWPVKGWTDNWKEDVIKGKETDYSSKNYAGDYWLSNLRNK